MPTAEREVSGEPALKMLARALRTGRSTRLEAQGFCMEPLISDGDRVEVRPIGLTKPGDVVLALDSVGGLVCHRVIAQSPRGVWLAGDRSMMLEEHTYDSLLGRVVGVERHGSMRPLDGSLARGFDWLEAWLHRISWRHRGSLTYRFSEGVRRLLAGSRRGIGAASDLARPASRVGTSSRFRPASSR